MGQVDETALLGAHCQHSAEGAIGDGGVRCSEGLFRELEQAARGAMMPRQPRQLVQSSRFHSMVSSSTLNRW